MNEPVGREPAPPIPGQPTPPIECSPWRNVYQHPKTTAAGLLIAIVAAAAALSQQGITLGHAGTGTVVALASAVATALLGAMAKDN